MRLHSTPAPAPAAADEYLTVKQAAARLGCSTAFLYKNDLPFVRKLGRKKLFSARGIQEYLDNPSR
jgi:excisionase family DNA binding protein